MKLLLKKETEELLKYYQFFLLLDFTQHTFDATAEVDIVTLNGSKALQVRCSLGKPSDKHGAVKLTNYAWLVFTENDMNVLLYQAKDLDGAYTFVDDNPTPNKKASMTTMDCSYPHAIVQKFSLIIDACLRP